MPRTGPLETRAAVQALPDAARRVVTLRFVFGMEQREIAARLGLSEDDVSRLLAQGVCAVAARQEGAWSSR